MSAACWMWARHVQSACSLTPRYLYASAAGSGASPQCRMWLVSGANCGATDHQYCTISWAYVGRHAPLAAPLVADVNRALQGLARLSDAGEVISKHQGLEGGNQAGACAAPRWRLICRPPGVWAGGWAAATALLVGLRRGRTAYGQGHALAGHIHLAQQIVNVDVKQQARQGVTLCCAQVYAKPLGRVLAATHRPGGGGVHVADVLPRPRMPRFHSLYSRPSRHTVS